MVLTGPGFFNGGRIQELVSLVDMPPTLLHAAGLPVPAEMEGRSILDGRKNWPDDVFIQISESQVSRAVRTKRWKYCVTAPDLNGIKDSFSPVYAEEYLYDLKHDPHELFNLIGYSSHREVSKIMGKRLLRYIKKVEGKNAEIKSAEEINAGQRRVFPDEVYQ